MAKQTGRCTLLYLRVCKVSGGTSLWTACGSCRLQWCTRTSAFPAFRLFLPTYPCTHSEHRFPAPSKDVVNQCLEFDPCTASCFSYFYTAIHPCSWLGIEYRLLTDNSYSLPGCIVHPWPHLSICRIIPFRIIFLTEGTPTKICGRCWWVNTENIRLPPLILILTFPAVHFQPGGQMEYVSWHESLTAVLTSASCFDVFYCICTVDDFTHTHERTQAPPHAPARQPAHTHPPQQKWHATPPPSPPPHTHTKVACNPLKGGLILSSLLSNLTA